MVIGELKLVITGKLICVASVLVPLVTVEAVPIVLLHGRSAFVNVIARPLVAFKRRTFNKVLCANSVPFYRSSLP